MKTYAIHHKKTPVAYSSANGWTYKEENIEVRVMAIAEGHAMVRRKRAIPFVVPVKELTMVTDSR